MLQDALIKAVHHGRTDSVAPVDDLLESPEAIASQFNGTCKRLGARQAAYVYWQSGGLMLGLVTLFIFAFTQTTRIMGDWWIRCVAADANGFAADQQVAQPATVTGQPAASVVVSR